MAEYFVHGELGSNANPGTEALPWLLIPGQSGANSISDGDTVNIRNGLVYTGGLVTIAWSNVIYRGYGLANNVLYVTTPKRGNPKLLVRNRLVRQNGVHEGMWIIDCTFSLNGAGILAGQGKVNIVCEDFHVRGTKPGSAISAVTLGGNSGANSSGSKLRRFQITGSSGSGITIFHRSPTIEDGRIDGTADDCITLRSGPTFNSYRANSTDTFRRLELSEPNTNPVTGLPTNVTGDLFQISPSTAQEFYASLLLEDIYGYKTSRGKQAMVLHDASNGITVRGFHLAGGGNNQILISNIRGAVLISDGYVANWTGADPAIAVPLIRFDASAVAPPAWGWNTGSLVHIKNLLVEGPYCSGILKTAWDFSSSYSFDGTVIVEGITVLTTVNVGTLTTNGGIPSSATFAFDSANSTYGANFNFIARNNILLISGRPHTTQPAGTAGSAQWKYQNNVCAASNWKISSTAYADLAAFQAANNQATGNNVRTQAQCLLNDSVGIDALSLLKWAGVQGKYGLDITGKLRHNPPSIGAYD